MGADRISFSKTEPDQKEKSGLRLTEPDRIRDFFKVILLITGSQPDLRKVKILIKCPEPLC